MFDNYVPDDATDPKSISAINGAVNYIVEMMDMGNLTTAEATALLAKYASKYSGMPKTLAELETYYTSMS
jgi:hypothetical protein